MPTISIPRDLFYKELGVSMSTDICNSSILSNITCCVADAEFDELCFEFGIELDEVVSYQSYLNSIFLTRLDYGEEAGAEYGWWKCEHFWLIGRGHLQD